MFDLVNDSQWAQYKNYIDDNKKKNLTTEVVRFMLALPIFPGWPSIVAAVKKHAGGMF